MSLRKNTMYWDNGYWYVDSAGYVYRFTHKHDVENDSSFPIDDGMPGYLPALKHLKAHGVEMVPSEANLDETD